MSELLHKVDFDPYVNQIFQVQPESADPVEMELIELTEKEYPGQESFSLIFRGPLEPVLPQRTYKLVHTEMGEIQLFMVPINYHRQDAIFYQSIFNRLIEE